ncbi:ABC transporter ATP-binding protein [Dehalococcoidia bacterium]|nr:ABC transporter ATP-binding protein [Dehalococcoidia bacterium]
MANDVLILEQVFKSYGRVSALSGLNLRVKEGEILGLPNGAGKTTTLKILSALLKPDSGIVSVGGVDVQSDPRGARRLIGYLPDLPLLYDELTVLDTLKVYANFWALEFDKTAALRALGEYELEALWNRRVRTLSKGQKQRLSLLVALLHDPPLILLDEPFTGLDIESREFLRQGIESLAEQGKTLVVSSHDLADVERISSSVALIVAGKVVSCGAKEEVKAKVVGNVFKIVLAEIPSDLEGLRECTREYFAHGDTVTFRLGDDQNVNEVVKYFIERNSPLRAFGPLGLEETLLGIMKGGNS